MVLYLFPFLLSVISSTAAFILVILAAKSGASPVYIGALGGASGLSYMLFCLLVGGRVHTGNARRYMVNGSLCLVGCCLLVVAAPWVPLFLVFAVLFNAAFSLFYPPFQIFMKMKYEQSRGLAFSAGLYTFSWSTGFGIGPLVSGLLMDHSSWRLALLVCGAIALGTAVVFRFYFDDTSGARQPAAAPPRRPFTLAGPMLPHWIGAFIGIFAFSILRMIFPQRGLLMGLSSTVLGLMLGIQGVLQALINLWYIRSHRWLADYRFTLGWGALGVAGLLVFMTARTAGPLYIASALFSFYTASLYFSLVMYALSHPEKSSRYVGVNEFVIGAAWTVGPLLGGVWARLGLDLPYAICAGLVAVGVALVSLVMYRAAGQTG